MMLLPCKKSKHIGDHEKGGQVLQTVGGNISQLPDETLECILNKLKLRDAVRAGLVSSRWRSLVLSRAELVFNWSNMFGIKRRDLQGASRKQCVCLDYKDQFVQAVYQFIASYRGTRITKFVVCFCLKIDSTCAVLNMIRLALGLGAEVLKVQCYCERFKSEVPTRCRIPIEFFPCRRPVVKHLLLSNCDAPETFTLCPFSQLETLTFYHLIFYPRDDMESVLSGLLKLKTLGMRECKLPPYLNLNSLTSLEDVYLWFCFGLEKIDVANLNKLNELKILSSETVSLELAEVPRNLKLFIYSVHDGGLSHIFSKLPEILPHLEGLRVDSYSNWIDQMPENIGTFPRLERLMLALDLKVGDIMFKIVQLLKSCPLLSFLCIVLSTREDKENEKLEPIEYYHEHLEFIEIRGFVGTKYQVESCIYLLKHAPCAKELVLRHDLIGLMSHVTEAGYRSRPVNEEERESALNALRAFSNDVKLFIT